MCAANTVAASTYPARASYRIAPGTVPSDTVLLLHGLGGDLDQLWEVPGHDVHAHRTLIAADARLHGHTVGFEADEVSFTAMAVDAFSLLEAVAPRPRYTLIGVSMGAGVAVRMAQLFPARIGKALLIRPAWTHTPNLGHLTPLVEIGELLRRLGPQQGKATFEQSATYRQIAHISAHAARSILSQFDRPHAVARARRLIELPADTPYPSPHTLTTLRCQAAVVGAPDDPLHSLHIAEQWADQLTGGHLDVLPNRDAEPALYDKMLADVVEKFLSNST